MSEAALLGMAQRIDALEKRIAELDERTAGMRRIGPSPRDIPPPQIPDEVIERVKELARAVPPVDRSARVLVDGRPVTDDHAELRPNGQQKAYVVLSPEERAKGFVRPVRSSYRHVGVAGQKHPQREGCYTVTTMGRALAETYARDPGFYSGTFCCGCGKHFPVGEAGEFVWDDGTGQRVGT